MRAFYVVLSVSLLSLRAETPAPYSEIYRPQYHFSPRQGWIGDPDGLIRYNGKYHLFWWGHAESSDLVFWNERPYPMKGADGSFTYYTGSVVVDENNTSGFGTPAKPPMVAIYTAHRKSGGLENQCLSYSTNHGTFDFYSSNPVLDIGSKSFRDPDVFWNPHSRRWIMVITLPDERKINFYASTNLKSWQYVSEFGPVGAREQAWEVPNLFQLPLNGDTNNMKWVLICGMGPNKGQYFVGGFDGTNFVMDAACRSFLSDGKGLVGEVFANFESADHVGWSVHGTAFGTGASAGGVPVFGHLGAKLVRSSHGGHAATGKLTSGRFTIARNCINFLLGGGNHPGQTCINLLVDGEVVRTATGSNSDALKWAGWDVSAWKGHQAQLEILDDYQGSWGYISVDHILFSDVLMDFNREHANWIDWGPDFYAVRGYRDYDKGARTDCWMGWMGNWEYAREIPTSWGRGAQSIPRAIELVTAPGGYAIRQQPWPELRKLRGTNVTVTPLKIHNTVPLAEFRPRRNAYEIEASFALDSREHNFGMNLCVGGTNRVVVGYNARTASLYLDRRASGNVSFNSLFPKLVTAPFLTASGELKFHIFVDQSSIEVFVNDGEAVMTALIFPDPANTGVEVFSSIGEVHLRRFTGWELNSIWSGVFPKP